MGGWQTVPPSPVKRPPETLFEAMLEVADNTAPTANTPKPQAIIGSMGTFISSSASGGATYQVTVGFGTGPLLIRYALLVNLQAATTTRIIAPQGQSDGPKLNQFGSAGDRIEVEMPEGVDYVDLSTLYFTTSGTANTLGVFYIQ